MNKLLRTVFFLFLCAVLGFAIHFFLKKKDRINTLQTSKTFANSDTGLFSRVVWQTSYKDSLTWIKINNAWHTQQVPARYDLLFCLLKNLPLLRVKMIVSKSKNTEVRKTRFMDSKLLKAYKGDELVHLIEWGGFAPDSVSVYAILNQSDQVHILSALPCIKP